MNLVWKLLRQHISIGQFAGFSLANLLGVLIILFGFQFYNDVLPVFTGDDSFMKNNYIIINKTIGTASTLTGRTNTFSNLDISEIQSQKFVRGVGQFVSANYKVEACRESTYSIPNSFLRACPTASSTFRSASGSTPLATPPCPSSCPVRTLRCTISVLPKVIRCPR